LGRKLQIAVRPKRWSRSHIATRRVSEGRETRGYLAYASGYHDALGKAQIAEFAILCSTMSANSTSKHFPKLLDVAREAAVAGGGVAERYFHEGVEMRTKESYNLVSDADVQAEEMIVKTIHSHFPDHAILGEEVYSGDTTAEHLWIVDPIDGTNNFAHQIPHFAVSIAYYRSGQAQAGVVFNPISKEWHWTMRGEGAWYNGNQVHVAETRQLTEALVGVGFYYDRGAMMEATLVSIRDLFRKQIHGIRRFGTASLDLCFVGRGLFGAYFEYELSAWDFAAGALFVEEAGGRTTNCDGDPLPVGKTSMLATNGHLHDAILEVIRPHWRKLRA